MFSVLMAFYRGDNPLFLQESFNSILLNPVGVNELVCVQDGVVDEEHLKIISSARDSFVEAGITFNYVKLEKNVGLGLALKEGVKHCREDYIVRMDSDDISLENRFSELSDFVKKFPDIDLVGAQIEEFCLQVGDLKRKRLVPIESASIKEFSKYRNPMNHVTVCIKKTALFDVGGYESVIWHEDYYLWMKFIKYNKNIKNIDSVHVYVRVSDFSSRRSGLRYFKEEVNFVKKVYGLGVFTTYDCFKYISIRFVARFSPSFINDFIYKFIRR
ncbi:MAG: glycosyltransferase [Gammaproteobacteria bacterium]|nr:glycosyltransferase [Gammaproteobacteria bacterium]